MVPLLVLLPIIETQGGVETALTEQLLLVGATVAKGVGGLGGILVAGRFLLRPLFDVVAGEDGGGWAGQMRVLPGAVVACLWFVFSVLAFSILALWCVCNFLVLWCCGLLLTVSEATDDWVLPRVQGGIGMHRRIISQCKNTENIIGTRTDADAPTFDHGCCLLSLGQTKKQPAICNLLPQPRKPRDSNNVDPKPPGARSSETFVALCLLVALGMGQLTEAIGLSTTLGAFAAGTLLAETNYRTQVEANISPFRGLLLGLFFTTTG